MAPKRKLSQVKKRNSSKSPAVRGGRGRGGRGGRGSSSRQLIEEEDEEEEEEEEEEGGSSSFLSNSLVDSPEPSPPLLTRGRNKHLIGSLTLPTKLKTPDEPVKTTSSSSSSSSSRSSSSFLKNSVEGPQDLSMLKLVERRAKGRVEAQQAWNKEDFFIDIEAAEKLISLNGRQVPYIKSLTFPRLYTFHEWGDTIYEVSLEPHVNLIVQYMMHLVTVSGLGVLNVYNNACHAVLTPAYFLGESVNIGPPLMSREIIAAIGRVDTLKRYLTRLAENWKTALKRKIEHIVPSLGGTFCEEFNKPCTTLEDLDEKDRLIHREVSVCLLCIYLMLISLSLSLLRLNQEINRDAGTTSLAS
jgi:hypothetical protein